MCQVLFDPTMELLKPSDVSLRGVLMHLQHLGQSVPATIPHGFVRKIPDLRGASGLCTLYCTRWYMHKSDRLYCQLSSPHFVISDRIALGATPGSANAWLFSAQHWSQQLHVQDRIQASYYVCKQNLRPSTLRHELSSNRRRYFRHAGNGFRYHWTPCSPLCLRLYAVLLGKAKASNAKEVQ